MLGDKEIEHASRLRLRVKLKRNTLIAQIRAVRAMALRVLGEKSLAPEFMIGVADLDTLWVQCISENENV